MDRMKTFLKYALWVVGFIILSEFLINVGLNSAYKDIKRKDNIEQVVIYQAEATKVNGRVRGIIKDAGQLNKKYIKVEFYSKRDILMGKKYIGIENEKDNETKAFEILFKMEDVASYKVNIVDKKEPGDEIEILPKEWTQPEILLATALTFLIFWG